jgi:hypothetical protein
MKTLAVMISPAVLCALGGCVSSSSAPDKALPIIQAQQAQPASARPASATPGQPPPPPAPAPVEQRYRGENGLHWVALVLDRGAQIKLEDGSRWEVAPRDRSQTLLWTVSQKLTVVRGLDPRYPFTMTNTDKTVTVDVRLLAESTPR